MRRPRAFPLRTGRELLLDTRDARDFRLHHCDTRLPPRTTHHRNNLVRRPHPTSPWFTRATKRASLYRSLGQTTSKNYCSYKWYVARMLVTFPCPYKVTLKCLLRSGAAWEYDGAPTGNCMARQEST